MSTKKPRFRPSESGWYASAENVLREQREILSSERRGFINHSMQLASSSSRQSAPNMLAVADGTGAFTRYQGSQRKADCFGFDNIGAFALAVKKASNPEPGAEALALHTRLQNAALSTYGSEGVGADGGFAIPPVFRDAVMQKVLGETELFGMCDVVPTASASVVIPKDEATPWGTSGIRGYWEGEAKSMPQSKPALEQSTIKLHKVQALVPMTDELIEDAPALSSWLTTKASEVIGFKLSDAIINGTGAGQPLGILNSGHKVSVSKESSQIADTIHGLNLIKMWSRMPAGWRRNGVWLVHPDAEPELARAGLQIKSADGATAVGGALIYMPQGSLSDSPYATLFGRPVIPTHACQALGDSGDIIFADLKQYAAFVRTPGLKTETSIHIWFDQGITAFRFSMRVGGQPWWSTPISSRNGSTTQSAFVTLEAR
jgi:HK97 family phage major capsid protein